MVFIYYYDLFVINLNLNIVIIVVFMIEQRNAIVIFLLRGVYFYRTV